MFVRTVLAASIFLGLCGGCAAQSASGPVAASEAAPVYKLDSGDKVRVTVYGEQSVNGEYSVGPNGDIALPLIGNVAAKGRTIDELNATISQKLASGYLLDPRVTIEVLSYRPYYILGEVSRPGQYPYASALSIDQAIATAGGYTYRASKSKVFVRRAGGAEEEIKLKKGTPVWVNPGDTIRIGERYF